MSSYTTASIFTARTSGHRLGISFGWVPHCGRPVGPDRGFITLLAAAAGTGTFTVNATGLPASTSYRFRAFARTSRGIVYSDVATFTTPGG